MAGSGLSEEHSGELERNGSLWVETFQSDSYSPTHDTNQGLSEYAAAVLTAIPIRFPVLRRRRDSVGFKNKSRTMCRVKAVTV
jgi:hypothetical protein